MVGGDYMGVWEKLILFIIIYYVSVFSILRLIEYIIKNKRGRID